MHGFVLVGGDYNGALSDKFLVLFVCVLMQQEEIALWSGVEGNGSMHNGDGTKVDQKEKGF